MTVYHIVHDTDRDGWGSAALLLAAARHERVRLYPQRGKDVVRVLNALELSVSDHIYVLDLPAPADWSRLVQPPCDLVWVDRHMASWTGAHPSWVNAIVATTGEPTTTMRLLVEAQLVRLPHAKAFIAGLCRRSPPYEWGLVFDSLQDGKPDVADFEELLMLGPDAQPVPASLRHLAEGSERRLRTVRALLDAAPSVVNKVLAVYHLSSAEGIPLRHYSLEIARRNPSLVSVVLHRRQTMYIARNGGSKRLDLIAYFRGRGFQPKGHPHVCFINVSSTHIEHQLVSLEELAERG